MFKRKDEDIDLLSEAGGSMTDQSKNEPKMGATPMQAVTPTTMPTTAGTSPTGMPTTQAVAKPATPAATAPNAGYTRPTDPAGVSRPTSFRPAADAGRPTHDYRSNNAPSNMQSNAPTATEKAKNSGRRVLTVGHDILLKGEIATCDRLVIEGAVDATLNEVHTVEISETGSFKGAAEIEDAEISGVFDGELTVRGRLVIYSTGQVRGKITYGEIEIERGGEMTGTIKSYKGEVAGSKKKSDDKKVKAAA